MIEHDEYYVSDLEQQVIDLERDLKEARAELAAISRAYAPVGVWFMDPPDGGSVTLAEQIGRLVEDWRLNVKKQ